MMSGKIKAAAKWAKIAEDGIFIIGKLGGDVSNEMVATLAQNLINETSRDTTLCKLAISQIKDPLLREAFEKKIDELNQQHYSRLLDNFPKERKNIFDKIESLSDNEAQIYALWEAVDQNLDTFHSAVTGLKKYQRAFVVEAIERVKGDFELFSIERKIDILLKELIKQGYEIKPHHLSAGCWKIKHPRAKSIFRRTSEIFGFVSLEDFYRQEIGNPDYSK